MVTDTAYVYYVCFASEGPKTADAFPDERATFMPALKVHAISHCCPRRDFAQKAKSRGGTLVTRAYILTVEIYSQLNRGREESAGNDGVFIVRAHKYGIPVKMTLRQKTPPILRYYLALRVISDIL